MTKPAAFQATYSDWKLIRGRKVVQIVFEVPIEHSGLVHEVLGGMPNPAAEVWCAIARLAKAKMAEPAQEPPQESPAPDPKRKNWHDMPPAQQAGVLCNDAAFQKFLSERFPILWGNIISYTDDETETAARIVRNECEITSRAELTRADALRRWQRLVSDYRAWMREPETVG